MRRAELVAAALVAALAIVAGWNAYKYPSGAGYDVRQHQEYADLLIHHGELPGPETRSEYYTPPGFYALAGAATLVGEHVHSGDPHKLGQVLNWLVLLATAYASRGSSEEGADIVVAFLQPSFVDRSYSGGTTQTWRMQQ